MDEEDATGVSERLLRESAQDEEEDGWDPDQALEWEIAVQIEEQVREQGEAFLGGPSQQLPRSSPPTCSIPLESLEDFLADAELRREE